MHGRAARGQSWECWLPPLPPGSKSRCNECTCTNASGCEATQGQAGGWLQRPGHGIKWVPVGTSFSSHHRSDLWDPHSCWWSHGEDGEGTRELREFKVNTMALLNRADPRTQVRHKGPTLSPCKGGSVIRLPTDKLLEGQVSPGHPF